jgi:hypothetical protein
VASGAKIVAAATAHKATAIASCTMAHPFIAAGCALGCAALGAAAYYLVKRSASKKDVRGNFERLWDKLDPSFVTELVRTQPSVNELPTLYVDYGLGGTPRQGFSAESSVNNSSSGSLAKIPNLSPRDADVREQSTDTTPRRSPRKSQ